MNTSPNQLRQHGLLRVFADPRVRVGLLALAALAIEAAIAAFVLDVSLNFFAQLAPFWVFTVYKLSGRRDRVSEIVASLLVVAATLAVLVAYAL